jgi:two-component system, LytTR family, sensor kinase
VRGGWWLAAATLVAIALAAFDARQREMQSALLLYFLASFWLALPRRAPALGVAAALGLVPLVVRGALHTLVASAVIPIVGAVALGVAAGTLAGRAFRTLEEPGAGDRSRGAGATLDARLLLSLALSAFAVLGLEPVWASLRWGGRALGLVSVPPVQVSLVATRWAQALTLVAWVALTPALLRLRSRVRGGAMSDAAHDGLTRAELGRHVGLVTVLSALHALALASLALLVADHATMFVGEPPSLGTLWGATAAAYAPFDLLTYIAILSLAHLGDRARQATEARRRAAAFEAAALEARLAAVRARLDPHFLYNALNAAVTLARRNHGDETSRLLEELTALLRYVLDDSRTSVPLREELHFAERYLAIMQLRFGKRLTYEIVADADLAEVAVPSLILQPVVENAVQHGVANAVGPVSIRVIARRASGRLILAVEDDGPGPHAHGSSGSGIGLGLMRERLAMLFGDRGAVVLAARDPRGAIATLTLPIAPTAVSP